LVAARELGWPLIAAVFVDDDPLTAASFAIADNRRRNWRNGIRLLEATLREPVVDDDERKKMLDGLACEYLEETPNEG
jgi:hypothetical protein